MAPSCILWQNDRKTVVLLDLPRSIEEAQVLSSELRGPNGEARPLRRLISALPPAVPFATPEPKDPGFGALGMSAAAQLSELMTQAAVESALEEIAKSHTGPWCLPRITSRPKPLSNPAGSRSTSGSSRVPSVSTPAAAQAGETADLPASPVPGPGPNCPSSFPGNDHTPPSPSPDFLPPSSTTNPRYHIPPLSHPLQGPIQSPSLRTTLLSTTLLSTTLNTATKPDYGPGPEPGSKPGFFNLIILDPPWPNRSAKRKRAGRHTTTTTTTTTNPDDTSSHSYQTAPDLSSIRSLLAQIPVAASLAPGGLVGVWVTNAPRFAELLTGSGSGGGGGGGLFAEWGVELVGEWTWVKVTAGGEPVVGVGSKWRKPWERLVIGRRRGGAVAGGGEGGGGGGSGSGSGGGGGGGKGADSIGGTATGMGTESGSVEGKVIVAVPDVHSRKPNLRALFEEGGLLPERYEALEVFARNLTAGWWAWGDEVLLFQRKECWVDVEEESANGSTAGTCS